MSTWSAWEPTGSYGVGLARYMASAGVRVVEVDRADRQDRHRQGKSDPLDAVSARTGRPVHAYEVRTRGAEDLREQIYKALMRHDWSVRRLDLRRRGLQDRWNEINNLDEAMLPKAGPAAPASGEGSANRAGSRAVTQ